MTAKLRDKASRAAEAKRLVEHRLIQEAFEKLETAILDGWKYSAADDEQGRYNAYLMHRLLGNLKSHFRQIVTTGRHAADELLRLEEAKKGKRR